MCVPRANYLFEFILQIVNLAFAHIHHPFFHKLLLLRPHNYTASECKITSRDDKVLQKEENVIRLRCAVHKRRTNYVGKSIITTSLVFYVIVKLLDLIFNTANKPNTPIRENSHPRVNYVCACGAVFDRSL